MTTLSLILDDLLTAADAALTDPPPRQYVSWGAPAWDCEQVVAWCQSIDTAQLPGLNNVPVRACVVVPRALLRVQVVRCVATPSDAAPPDAAELDADGERGADDAWSLFHGIRDTVPLFPSLPNLDLTTIEWRPGVTVETPQGGYAAVTLGFTLLIA